MKPENLPGEQSFADRIQAEIWRGWLTTDGNPDWGPAESGEGRVSEPNE